MGGFPSEEKKKDIIEDDIYNVADTNIKLGESHSHHLYDCIKNFTATTPQNEVSSRLENYGILPDLVITKIALFLPLNELSKVYQTCKLFYHCGNSKHFWRLYFENMIENSSKEKVNNEESEVYTCESIFGEEEEERENSIKNWKRKIFLKHYFTDKNYRRILFQQGRERDTTEETITLKTVMIGPPFVGKTSFCLRVIRDEFRVGSSGTTIGAAFCTNIFRNNITKKSFKIEIWDTVGMERYRDFAPMYYRASDIIFLCFSLTDRESFYHSDEKRMNFQRYFKKMKDNVLQSQYPIVVLLGMKCDLKESYGVNSIRGREVKHEDVVSFLKENKEFVHGYVENSSRDGKNIMLSIGFALDLYSRKMKKK